MAHGADPNLTSNSGCSAAHEAAYRGYTEFLALLAAAGANLAQKCSQGKTPLDYAKEARQEDTVQWIKQYNSMYISICDCI